MERRLEICVDAPSGIRAALEGGADRLELCAALELGGLTPSLAQIHAARALPAPVAVMIRPRGGDFVYGPDEVELMVQDIGAVRAAGLQGVVFGAQTPVGTLDAAVLKRLTAAAGGLETTLHRAFDAVPDLFEALKTATALGFTRILTSGGCKTAPDGAATIARLIASARGRILVMPGGGVAPGNARALLEATGALELHASCSLPLPAPSERLARAAGVDPAARDLGRARAGPEGGHGRGGGVLRRGRWRGPPPAGPPRRPRRRQRFRPGRPSTRPRLGVGRTGVRRDGRRTLEAICARPS